MKAMFLVACAYLLLACDEPAGPTIEAAADLVLHNGAIYTVETDPAWAEAVAVQNGVLVYVGDDAGVEAWVGEETAVIDLDGRMVLPGLHDVHAHPLEARSPFAGTCLLDAQEVDAEAFIPILKACAPQQIGTDWVLGFGHSVFTLLESFRAPIEILDEAIPDRPAVIMEETSHSVWVNTQALAAAGIDANTPNPPGGVIVRDPQTGAPTGVLFDAAGDLVMDLAWQPTATIQQLNYEGLLDAVAEMNRYGITSVVEGRTYWRRGFEDAWLRAEAENQLTLRAVLALWAYPSLDDATQLAALRTRYRDDPDALVRINQIKVYSDGILINTTAAMLEPYRETLGAIPSADGLNYFTEARLAEYVRDLEPTGFDFFIHAIGDRGVREALNALEAAATPAGRHRLTHLEVVDPADFSRFAALNVTADAQVAGTFTQPDHWHENELLIGDRASPLVPIQSLHEAGARLTLSSDWDVSTLNPFIGMQNALTRAPQQLPDLATVIAAYTRNAAYTMRQEDRVGTLAVGKEADLVVLDRNLFEIPVTSIAETQVVMTFLAGKRVYGQ